MYRIVILSCEGFLRDLVRLSIADMRAEVRCAADLAELQRLCRRGLFDLAIVLQTTPFLCGRDVVRILRPEGLRRPPVYVVAWQQSEQRVLGLLECGVDQYMTFPLSLQRFRSKVANELDRRL